MAEAAEAERCLKQHARCAFVFSVACTPAMRARGSPWLLYLVVSQEVVRGRVAHVVLCDVWRAAYLYFPLIPHHGKGARPREGHRHGLHPEKYGKLLTTKQ